jgi:hypothetical protein
VVQCLQPWLDLAGIVNGLSVGAARLPV